jgi:hypothetical protein
VATEYWPFLVAANQQLDYRVILCPNFINEAGRSDILRTNVGNVSEDDHEGRLLFIQVQDRELGPFGIFFSETKANSNGEPAFDLGSRPVRRFAGLVVKGVVNRQQFKSAEAEKLLIDTEREFQACFEAFWKAGKNGGVNISGPRICGEQTPEPVANPDVHRRRTTDAGPIGKAEPLPFKDANIPPVIADSKSTSGSTEGSTRSIAYALAVLSLVFCAASTLEYLSLRRQLHDVISLIHDRIGSQSELSLLKSKIDTIESRLPSDVETRKPSETR